MSNQMEQIAENLRSRLSLYINKEQDLILNWLWGNDKESLKNLTSEELKIKQKGWNFRLLLLEKNYLNLNPSEAYSNLIKRLSSLVIIRQKIRTWLAQSRNRQQTITEVIQEVVQEILKSDHYIQEQMKWIANCTNDHRWRNILMLVTLEEYCLRPIRNQPLLAHRFVNFLRHQERGGLTQVPRNDLIHLISEEFKDEDNDTSSSLFDSRAIAQHENQLQIEAQQKLRQQVKEELANYLGEKLGSEAVTWLKLYLKGYSAEAIAQKMNVPVKQIYRLREKINYHTLKGFAVKIQPDLVANWLEISLFEDNLGLTEQEWSNFWEKLTPVQQTMIKEIKKGEKIETMKKKINLKNTEIMSEWTNIYLTAQRERNKTNY